MTPATTGIPHIIHLSLYLYVHFAGDQRDIAVGAPAGVRVDGRLVQHDHRGREGLRARDAR